MTQIISILPQGITTSPPRQCQGTVYHRIDSLESGSEAEQLGVRVGDVVVQHWDGQPYLQSNTYSPLSTAYVRRVPKMGISGTCIFLWGKPVSPFAPLDYFSSTDIVRIFPRLRLDEAGIIRFCMDGNKHVIPQLSDRSCTIASSLMLLSDCGQPVPKNLQIELNRAELGDKKTIENHLTSAGLIPKQEDLPLSSQEEIFPLLQNYLYSSSLIFSAQGHAMVLDALEESGAVVRDPFHGWKIMVTREGFWNFLSSEGRVSCFSITRITQTRL